MVAARAQVDSEIHIEGAARAEEDRRLARIQARSVGGDQHVRREEALVLLTDFPEARRTNFFAGLDQHLHVEAELAAYLQRGGERREVDGVLALVVGGAAAVEAIALALQRPGIEARAPAFFLAADHVAVAVGEDRDQRGVLDALGEQERSLGDRMSQRAAAEAELFEARLHLCREVAREVRGPVRVLALGGDGDAARKIGEEAALVEVPLSLR